MSNLGWHNQLGGARHLFLRKPSNEMRHLKGQGKIWLKTQKREIQNPHSLCNLLLTELSNFLGGERHQCLFMNANIF